MMIGAWKIAPALAAGNSVVLKPAEGASLTLLRLAELCAEAGLPDGVLNVVTGYGPVVGEALGLHMDVDVLVFTGSGGVGRQLLEYSARSNLARDEVFGPVLAVMRFSGEAEALRIANSGVYGLAPAVGTSNFGYAHRMVRGIRAGVMHVNTYGGADGTVPLGGVRQSGNGHDKSLHALDKYPDLKTAWMQI